MPSGPSVAAEHLYPRLLSNRSAGPRKRIGAAAADARFLDLLGPRRGRTPLFRSRSKTMRLVSRSMQLDEGSARLPDDHPALAPGDDTRVFVDEGLSLEPVTLDRLEGGRGRGRFADRAIPCAVAGISRVPGDGGGAPSSSCSCVVGECGSRLSRTARFKFSPAFLKLFGGAGRDEEVMDPRPQGQFVHEVFERFFDSCRRRDTAP